MKAKFIAKVDHIKGVLTTVSLKDNRTGEYKDGGYICSRNVATFSDSKDMVETLNWNLNGRTSRCCVRERHAGYTVYIYD